MIERLTTASIPTSQPRTAINEGTKVNSIKLDEKPATNKQFDHKKVKQEDQEKETEKLHEIVKGLNSFLQPSHTSLKFKLHEKLNEYYVTIVDDNTNEVIREIPSKKLLDTYAEMAQHLGILIDKKI